MYCIIKLSENNYTQKGGKYKQLNISTIVIKCVQIYSKENFNMKTSNITNYKPKDFAEL